jgi:hypothetical protein
MHVLCQALLCAVFHHMDAVNRIRRQTRQTACLGMLQYVAHFAAEVDWAVELVSHRLRHVRMVVVVMRNIDAVELLDHTGTARCGRSDKTIRLHKERAVSTLNVLGRRYVSARTKTAKVLEQKAFREQLLNSPGFSGGWNLALGRGLLTRNLRNRLYLSTVRRIVYLSSQALALSENSRKARPQVRCKMTGTVGPLIASSRSAGIFCRIFVPILFGVSITPAFANPVFIVRGSPGRLRKGGSRVETDFHT